MRRGYTLLEILVGIMFLTLPLVLAGWGANLYKLTQLDFKAPYKAECLRAVGVATPIGAVIGFIDIKDE